MDKIYPQISIAKKAQQTLLSLLLILFVFSQSSAQLEYQQNDNPTGKKVAIEKLVANSNGEQTDYIITAQHVSRTSGIHHMYLRQAINGIEVFGTESSIHKDQLGNTIQVHNKFVADLAQTVRSSAPAITASGAISRVAQQMGYEISDLQEIERKGTPNQEALYNKAGISVSNIPVKLMYYFREGMETVLIWELSVEETTSSDWWNFRVMLIQALLLTRTTSRSLVSQKESTAMPTMTMIQKKQKNFFTQLRTNRL